MLTLDTHQTTNLERFIMSTKTFLYKRPAHHPTKVIERRDGNMVLAGEIQTSAFDGIDAAIRGVAMGNNTLAMAIRILRKLEKAKHEHEPNLHHQYVVFTEQEKQIICSAMNQFNWSEFGAQTGNTTWTRWIDFLEGFDAESELFSKVWLEYDPMKPPAEYAEWLVQYEKDLAAYNEKVAAARAAVLATKTNPPADAPATSESGAETSESGDAGATDAGAESGAAQA